MGRGGKAQAPSWSKEESWPWKLIGGTSPLPFSDKQAEERYVMHRQDAMASTLCAWAVLLGGFGFLWALTFQHWTLQTVSILEVARCAGLVLATTSSPLRRNLMATMQLLNFPLRAMFIGAAVWSFGADKPHHLLPASLLNFVMFPCFEQARLLKSVVLHSTLILPAWTFVLTTHSGNFHASFLPALLMVSGGSIVTSLLESVNRARFLTMEEWGGLGQFQFSPPFRLDPVDPEDTVLSVDTAKPGDTGGRSTPEDTVPQMNTADHVCTEGHVLDGRTSDEGHADFEASISSRLMSMVVEPASSSVTQSLGRVSSARAQVGEGGMAPNSTCSHDSMNMTKVVTLFSEDCEADFASEEECGRLFSSPACFTVREDHYTNYQSCHPAHAEDGSDPCRPQPCIDLPTDPATVAGDVETILRSVAEAMRCHRMDRLCATLARVQTQAAHEGVTRVHLVVPWSDPEEFSQPFVDHMKQKLATRYPHMAVMQHTIRRGSLLVALDIISAGAVISGGKREAVQLEPSPKDWLDWMQLPWPKDGSTLFVQIGITAHALQWDAPSSSWVEAPDMHVPAMQDIIQAISQMAVPLPRPGANGDHRMVQLFARVSRPVGTSPWAGPVLKVRYLGSALRVAVERSEEVDERAVVLGSEGVDQGTNLRVSFALGADQPFDTPGVAMLEIWMERIVIQSVPILLVPPSMFGIADELRDLSYTTADDVGRPTGAPTHSSATISKLGLWLQFIESRKPGALSDPLSPRLVEHMIALGRWLLEDSILNGWAHASRIILMGLVDHCGFKFCTLARGVNPSGHTLLHSAVLGGKAYMVALVLQWGVEMHKPWSWYCMDLHGVTPLHLVALTKHAKLAEALLRHFEPALEAWTQAKGRLGSSPAEVALQTGMIVSFKKGGHSRQPPRPQHSSSRLVKTTFDITCSSMETGPPTAQAQMLMETGPPAAQAQMSTQPCRMAVCDESERMWVPAMQESTAELVLPPVAAEQVPVAGPTEISESNTSALVLEMCPSSEDVSLVLEAGGSSVVPSQAVQSAPPVKAGTSSLWSKLFRHVFANFTETALAHGQHFSLDCVRATLNKP